MIATPIQIRYADCDMGGHVHNAAYLHYFESARMTFFVSDLGTDWDWKKFGFILKKNTIEYHVPVYLTDQIIIEVTCVHIGEKSFTLSYEVKDQHNVLKTYGESVVVCLDYTAGKTIPVPEKVREVLNKHRRISA